MRKIIKCFCYNFISIVLLCIFSINTYAVNDAQTKEFMNNHSEILKSIKESSECINKKGDIRIDFLEEIIHFNDIQICMAENIIKCSDSKDIRNVAKNLIKNSMECTTELNESLYNISKNPSVDKVLEEKYINDYLKLYNNMILNLQCGRENESIEKVFIKASIKQHEALIDLTDIFEKYSNDEKILQTSKEIKNKNIKEIKKLKNLNKKYS